MDNSIPAKMDKSSPPPVNMEDLTARRKMLLLVDLDHTIIHTHNDRTVIRPGLKNALKEWHEKFDLVVCTMGCYNYAKHILSIIDPDKKYFKGKFFCEMDYFFHKSEVFEYLCPDGDNSAIVMVDDYEYVWCESKNLVLVDKYVYFKEGMDESADHEDKDTYLKTLTRILKDIHREYYYRVRSVFNTACPHSKDVIASLRKWILADVNLYLGKNVKYPDLVKRRAIEMGAKIADKVDSSVTHYVTAPFPQAVESGGIKLAKSTALVTDEWITKCYTHWRKVDEETHK